MLKVVPFLALLSLMAYATTPKGFTRLNQKYLVSDSEGTFFGAYITCKSFGFKMASVTNEEDAIQLNNTLNPLYSYFLGGVYANNHVFAPKWIWIDTGDELNYTSWAPREPSLVSGDNCLARRDGLWYAYSCASSYYYVCET